MRYGPALAALLIGLALMALAGCVVRPDGPRLRACIAERDALRDDVRAYREGQVRRSTLSDTPQDRALQDLSAQAAIETSAELCLTGQVPRDLRRIECDPIPSGVLQRVRLRLLRERAARARHEAATLPPLGGTAVDP